MISDNWKFIGLWKLYITFLHFIYLHNYLSCKLHLELELEADHSLWVTTFLPDWQPPLIFVQFISNFLCVCSDSMASAHVILKLMRQRLRVAVSQEEKW